MSNFFECHDCHKVTPMLNEAPAKCSSCESTNGVARSPEHVGEAFDKGAYFNIAPKTGKPQKAKH